jgi:hypothetical protein
MSQYFGIIEAVFVFSLALAFYVWQMRDLKREKQREEERRRQARGNEPPSA